MRATRYQQHQPSRSTGPFDRFMSYAMGFLSLFNVNVELTSLLMLLEYGGEKHPPLLSISLLLMNFICLLLDGWLFFSVFFFIQNKKYNFNNDQATLFFRKKALPNFAFITLCRIAVISTAFKLGGDGISLPNYVYIPLLFIVFVWSIVRIVRRWLKNRIENINLIDTLDISIKNLQLRAIKKISKLNEREQREVAETLYQKEELSRATAQNVVWIILVSTLFGLLIEIVEEIIKRI